MKENREKFLNYELQSTKLSCIVSLPQDFLFRSAEAELKPGASQALEHFFRKIRELPEHVEDMVVVEGHTDNLPIKTSKFRNNWELSTARATNIATMLIDQFQYKADTVSVNGFAETRPKVPYTDVNGKPLKNNALNRARRINRRVEIILTSPMDSTVESNLLFDGKK